MKSTSSNVGFPFALDESLHIIQASDAQKGKTYKCPYCSCQMHVNCNAKGTFYFSKYPNTSHENPICNDIERTGKCHTFAQSSSPSELIMSLLRPPVPTGSNEPNTDKSSTESPKNDEINDSNPTMLPFKNLKQIYEYGKNQNDPFQDCRNFKISDCYIHYSWFIKLFTSNAPINLGARIVQVGYEGYDSNSHSLIFHAYTSSRRDRSASIGDYPSVQFEIKFKFRFRDRNKFSKYLKTLCTAYSKDNETTGYRTKQVLLASTNWERLPPDQCLTFCKTMHGDRIDCSACHGMHETPFISPKQIFIVPDKKKKKV